MGSLTEVPELSAGFTINKGDPATFQPKGVNHVKKEKKTDPFKDGILKARIRKARMPKE